VANKILGFIFGDGVNCGFGAVQQCRESESQVRVGWLGAVRVVPAADGNTDIFVSQAMRDAIAEWCKRARAIPPLLEQGRPVTVASAFGGAADGPQKLRDWIDSLFPPELFPLVEQTRSAATIRQLAQRFGGALRLAVLRTVPASDVLSRADCITGTGAIDWARPVLSVAPDDSFGCAGYVVGFSEMTRLAAVLVTRENAAFAPFTGEVARRLGVVVSLDALIQL
jgi:hypothetical protein